MANAYYVSAPSLQQTFHDKNSGELLASGYIKSFRNDQRLTPKPIYKYTGTPGAPNFEPLENPLTLNSTGSICDPETGEVIVPYYFPFISQNDDTRDSYYIQIFNSKDELQQTYQDYPPVNSASSDDTEIENFAPNGQFLLHNEIHQTNTPGEINQLITNVAYGGWTFERSNSGAKDKVTFERFGSWTSNPSSNPRYSLVIESDGTHTYERSVKLKIQDVNWFANDTDTLTIQFSAESLGSGSVPISLGYIKNFGTDGSSQTSIIPISTGTFNVETGTYQDFIYTFKLGSNSGKTIGTLDDDYIQFVWSLPEDTQFKLGMTDVIISAGAHDSISYPERTYAQQITEGLASQFPVPAKDGSNLYLTPKLTPHGWIYDDSEIGKYRFGINITPEYNELPCDGLQTYKRSDYSDLGIPYSRLFDKLWDSTNFVPKSGTGLDYFTAVFPGDGVTTNTVRIFNNTKGTVTGASDGVIPTGFTFPQIHAGSDYQTKSYLIGTNTFQIRGVNIGSGTNIHAQTSGFTVSVIQSGTTKLSAVFNVITVSASSLSGGEYFTYGVNGPAQPFYVWFKVDGAGSDPSVSSHTGILVNLISTDTDAIVAQKISSSLNGFYGVTINMGSTNGSSLANSSSFNINATGDEYYVWYNKSKSGTDPSISNKTGIEVTYSDSDSTQDIAEATRTAINRFSFATPDLRGAFIRIFDNGAGNDPDANERWSHVPGIQGDAIGTFQYSENKSHRHSADFNDQTGGSGSPTVTADDGQHLTDFPTEFSGGKESRPYNAYVNAVIKY